MFTNKILDGIIIELSENSSFNKLASSYYRKLMKIKKEKKILSVKLEEEIFLFLTSIRNKNLIKSEEQEKLRKSVLVFFGMSVGSHAATSWMLMSRASSVKISDPDTISLSNLNRLELGVKSIGKLKVDVMEQKIKEINPYCKVFSNIKTDEETLNKMILGYPKVDIIVDAMDDLKSKILIRIIAREHKIPVLMATDVGDNVFLDIERYDKIPSLALFNGRVKLPSGDYVDKLSSKEKMRIMIDIVGLENNSERMIKSLLSIGKTIKTWPQLGSTATISGGLVATTVKKIILGENVKSGRYVVSIDNLLDFSFNKPTRVSQRARLENKMLNILD